MKIGVPREIKNNENRVGATPSSVQALVADGHQVFVEIDAGVGSGYSDAAYQQVGATILNSPQDVYGEAEMIVKVKEPIEPEYDLISEGQILFTYFHFAASRQLTDAIVDSKAIAIAYETVVAKDGSLPLLVPMSEVAGRMATQEGAKYLERPEGGRGILLGGIPGTRPANVLVLGGGIVGTQATKIAAGFGANVTIMDTNLARLRYLDDVMPKNVDTIASSPLAIQQAITTADLVIGAVLIPGAKAPWLITREMLGDMMPGAVIVDVSVDQGGCVETSKPTTHADPVFMVDGILHYGVANMPGAVPFTSTLGLTNATTPYMRRIASLGYKQALQQDPGLLEGLNVINGTVTHTGISEVFGLDYVSPQEALGLGSTVDA